jgi:hypothetical protein
MSLKRIKVKEPYYPCICNACGYQNSSEAWITDGYDDCAATCPKCHADNYDEYVKGN